MTKKTELEYFDEGREARWNDKPQSVNPYSASSNSHYQWDEGWRSADNPDWDEKDDNS
ncbi:ribosome modulation factor [Beijerinckia indica]|uniref:ribosome modulation factor n=1 Tax=Beijerinckia indica TaxID=533 RepID=UPI0013052556|nr:hypothetical protein [Beijerinckia indica]